MEAFKNISKTNLYTKMQLEQFIDDNYGLLKF